LVEYLGRSDVYIAGYCTAQLAASRIADIQTLVRASPLASLNSGQDASDSALTRVLYGLPDGGYEELSTTEMEVDSVPPLPLLKLARRLDELAGVARWVGGIEDREREEHPLVHHECPKRLSTAWSQWFPTMEPPERPSPQTP